MLLSAQGLLSGSPQELAAQRNEPPAVCRRVISETMRGCSLITWLASQDSMDSQGFTICGPVACKARVHLRKDRAPDEIGGTPAQTTTATPVGEPFADGLAAAAPANDQAAGKPIGRLGRAISGLPHWGAGHLLPNSWIV